MLTSGGGGKKLQYSLVSSLHMHHIVSYISGEHIPIFLGHTYILTSKVIVQPENFIKQQNKK